MDEFDSLFNSATVIGESDSEIEYFVIDHDFRTIEIPLSKQIIGVMSDEKVNVLHFKCPRYYGAVDLGAFSFRINYLNAYTEGDQYLVDDKVVGDDEIIFSWTVGRHACKYSGYVNFVVCAFIADKGEITHEYNTSIHSLQVKEGIETTAVIVEENYDVIADLLSRTENLVDVEELEEQMTEATEAAKAAQAKIYTLTLSLNWSGDYSPFTQTITIPNYTVTNKTKIDLTADQEIIDTMNRQGIRSIYIINNSAVLTAYADGHKPSTALTVQASVYETAT